MKTTFWMLSLLASNIIYAQDFQQNYQKLCEENRREEILPLIQEWEKTHPKDAEMLIAYFNYYLQESKREVIQLSTDQGEGNNLVITDTGTNEPAGYMYSSVYYLDSLFDKAQDYLKKGIGMYPRRLDMYFGRIYSLREKGRLEEHVFEILNVIELHKRYKDQWLWSGNVPVDEPEEMFKGSIQDYLHDLFYLSEPYIDGVEEITNKMLKLYPNDLIFYSNLGVCELLREDYPQALQWFVKAETLNSKDVIVLGNIAYTYLQMDNREKAIEYYQKVIEVGGPEDIEFAKSQLERLRKD